VGVRCVSFAAPPVGNAALAATVRARGWEPLFRSLLTPHDLVPHLLSLPQLWAAPRAAGAAADTDAAEPSSSTSLLSERSLAGVDAALENGGGSGASTSDSAAADASTPAAVRASALPVYEAFGWRTLLLDGHPLHSRLQRDGDTGGGGGEASTQPLERGPWVLGETV
jgi:hypothetical protein